MPFPVLLIPCIVAIGSGLSSSLIIGATKNDYWYDYWNDYFIFPEEYTDIIDIILSNTNFSKLGMTKIISATKKIPDEGVHYYYRYHSRGRTSFNKYFIGLEKKKKKNPTGGKDIYYYKCFSSPMKHGVGTFNIFKEKVMSSSKKTVRVISIDTSTTTPHTVFLSKKYKEPRQNQKQVIDHIVKRWTSENDFNIGTIICGKRGLGKTFIGRLLKRHIDDNNDTNARVMLFDDFDPSSIGVNIGTMALKHASASSPVIIIINEIDIFYDKVFDEQPTYDPRTQYTKNKLTFNTMLDNLSDTKHVITIYTTEKSYEELQSIERIKSFIRHGRVDFFINMTADKSTLIENN